jgi:hypothetical protein
MPGLLAPPFTGLAPSDREVAVYISSNYVAQGVFSHSIFPNANLSALTAAGVASCSFQYVDNAVPCTGTRIDALVSWSGSSSATANTGALAFSAYAGIYTNSASSLVLLSSGSTQTTYSSASNNSGASGILGGGIRPISVPINFNLGVGEYIVGFNFLTATSSIGTATTNDNFTVSIMGGVGPFTARNIVPDFTAATATSVNIYNGMGLYSAAVTGLPTTPIAFSNINQTGVNLINANIALVLRNV